MEDSRLEDCLLTADGTQRQSSGSGQTSDPTRSEDGLPGGPHASGGLGLLGQATPYRGSKAYISTGPSPTGLVFYGNGNGKPKEKAGPLNPDGEGLLCCGAHSKPLRGPDMDISTCWGKDDQWGLRRGDETQWGGISRTDSALLEEDARYVPSSSGMVALDPSPPFSSSFGRTPRKESFDRSGLIVESTKGDCLCKEIGHSEQFVGKCWDLVEISNDSMEDDRKALCLARPISQEEGAWVEERWEESDLARFSQFLGFSTEGLEKDILEFMVKIRKRRERIHSKAMLEKSKFERELRRLECSVNYEGGRRERVLCKEEGAKLWKSNENKALELEWRFLDWGALDAQGAAGGILICWDKRTLEILEMEMGQFTISCRLRNVEDGKTWIFTGVYGPFSKEDRDTFWGELGAIRGIWDDPWCVGVTDELELLDIPLQGGVASWSGGRNNQAWARLDRFLVTQDWLDCFNGVLQCRLPRPVSDHFPILLKGGGGRGRASFRVASKLKFLKDKIKSWNRDMFGRLEVNKNLALQQVEFWDRVESDMSLTERESELKTEAKEAFKNWVLLEETHWRQSSRELWLREGDKNTGFFHRMANAHRRNNSMDKIKINGRWLEEEREVREGVVNAFQQLLSEDQSWKSDIEGLQLKSLNHAEAEGLEQPFTEAEIHLALMGMNGDKAPGPDGFTVAFWQFCWEFVKEEIVDVFKEFYEDKSFAKSLNSTFLVLIPKKGGAEDLGDFRPISLLGGVYKLLAKVLSNRVKEVLDKVVSPDQNAFVKGRQILDASLIANEVIDYWLKRKEKGVICKLDIEKAYDSINWNFLMKVMRKMGFGDRWMKWIWWCISTASFSILVNGVPAGYFSNSRGLRQGDPLSPYLFVLGMEVLSAMLRRAVDGGFTSGCNIQGRGGMEINVSHLLFADDTIIFCEVRQDHITYLSWILVWFEAASGLRINLAKSEVIPVGEVEDIEMLAVELGCKVGTLPSVYLGLPLGAKHKAMAMWDGVEARMRRRLALWKRQYLSKGGRITLIKSTLASMPIYQLSLFRMPKLVVKRLEKLQRDFLWGGGSSVGEMDWRFAIEEDFFWRKVVGVKYGRLGFGWRTKEARGTFGVGVWRDILKESSWCWDNIEFKVGKGTKVNFWTDHWCGNEVLAQTFPQLFELAVQRNASVNEMWDSSLGQGGWNIRLSRNFNDWELDALGELLHLLRDLRTSLEEDAVIWKGESHGLFWIRDAYKLLSGSNVIIFPKKSIWVNKVPTKVAFFAWEASWEKVLTLDKLQRQGWQFPNRCFLCGCEEENVNHILLHCTVVRALWEIVLALFGANWVFPEKVKDMLVSWRGPFVGERGKGFGLPFRCVFFGRFGMREID
ncbi:LINE-1 retrotransposable element ORF2 protein [Vitis vinifera]|uniref:LINE-1 retrotransposable element ORF2 protein n=1 Tax=Vitis vinifera TaxID=29760 RepID=A0A438DRU8_VITVI|nr:LINE-1 retrotransposable element ORF2 protein [Vitis vinifera]